MVVVALHIVSVVGLVGLVASKFAIKFVPLSVASALVAGSTGMYGAAHKNSVGPCT